MPVIALTTFATRNHFENPDRAGTKFCGLVSPEHFVKRINLLAMSTPLVPSAIPGMEDFCSHLIVENWSDCSSGVVAITDENRGFVQSDGDFGIVNIAAHMTNEESPMAPSTVVRNALGTASGGNGAAFYIKTNEIGADYWSRMIAVK